MRSRATLVFLCASAVALAAQTPPAASTSASRPHTSVAATETPGEFPSQPASAAGASSSRKYVIDLSPPIGDLQEHPESQAALAASGVDELHPWDPHRAAKDIEVGNFYLKQQNYRGAEMRFRDALHFKPNDAVATYHLAQVCEHTGRLPEAIHFYQAYLKILPSGPYAKDARRAADKLQAKLESPR